MRSCQVSPLLPERRIVRVLRAGTIKRIHVNRSRIDANRKHGRADDVLTVQTSKGAIPGRRVVLMCQCGREVAWMDQDARQLPCGARVYVETTAEVQVSAVPPEV